MPNSKTERGVSPYAWIHNALESLEQSGLRRRHAERRSAIGPRIVVDGKSLINFGSNDYLGLAGDPRLAEAAADAAREFGWGAGASPSIIGRTAAHVELETRIAAFEGTEAALLFPSGFAANAGTIPALVGRGDAIYADAKNHASLIDGCRLSNATRHVYRHGDVGELGAMLRDSDRFRRKLIVTDTLFSMDGDRAPLGEIGRLANDFGAMVLLDEAHATGVFGVNGRGLAEEACESTPDEPHPFPIRIGTLSKALGSIGGFVCGARTTIDWLANRARTYVYSTAPPPAFAAAAIAALDIVRDEPERRLELQTRSARLREELAGQGWNTGDSDTHIIPMILGDSEETMRLASAIRERGIFVPGIRPPTVPAGESMLRISVCWGHTEAMLAELRVALAECRQA